MSATLKTTVVPQLRDYQARFIKEELLPLELDHARILEVGAARGEICQELANRVPSIREIIGINVEDRPLSEGDRWRLVRMDACELNFPAASFDVVYSLASFEHINDLPRALSEMHRVLRPGGLLVSVWSPIWSGFNGHHYGTTVSHQSHTDIELPWAHLILSPQRLPDYLVAGENFSQEEAHQAAERIHQSAWLNRLTFTQYERILFESAFTPTRVDSVEVDFAQLLGRIQPKVEGGLVQPRELLSFFARTPAAEVLVYKLKTTLRR